VRVQRSFPVRVGRVTPADEENCLGAVLMSGILTGCAESKIGASSGLGSGPRRVAESYLRGAASADGSAMYGLLGSSERDDETPDSLRKTAAERYSRNITWNVLTVEESGSSAKVIVDLEGADVDLTGLETLLTE
jgi:hypothetical protein